MPDPSEVLPQQLPAAASTGPVAPAAPRKRVAPLLHTALLIVVLLGFSFLTAHSQHKFAERNGRPAQYVMVIAWEWILFAYVVYGLRRERVSLRELTGGRWRTPEDVLLDIAPAAVFWIVAITLLAAIGHALGLTKAGQFAEAKKQIAFLIPRSNLELALWIGLSATAGFCEEIIFRGYLQRQLAALTQSTIAGVLISALLFGSAHAYEGGKRMVLIAIYGAMFGLLAWWRKSLRPGMMAHAFHDSFTGAMLRFMG